MPFLKEDMHSRLNPKTIYGREGEEVAVLHTNGGVLIVQSVTTGNKFPVLPAEITDGEEVLAKLEATAQVEPEPDPVPRQTVPKKKRSRRGPPPQNTLF